jgi:3,4-dihydroxy 2-butanone 4-phosphate synthase/GTP cyclohydrolase II
MDAIAREGRGLVIYEHQEGRGIGLMAKLQAYALQEEGLDTVDANYALGYCADYRDFSLPAAILHYLDISRVRLLTNNPDKSSALRNAQIDVDELPCETPPTLYSLPYLRTKKEKMGHTLFLGRHRELDELSTGDKIVSPRAVTRPKSAYASIESAISELRMGRMVVVVDDDGRENEGDLIIAAEMITPDAINFMATHGRGLICLAMTEERLDQLHLAPMVFDNTALHETAFTISIDAKGHGVTTGISAYDRAQTIRLAIDDRCSPEDLARPGHIFPLRARPGGVLERRGHTEAAVDLGRLAGLAPAGVICEILNDDGSMARVPDLVSFCKKHALVMITVADLAQYRLELETKELLQLIDEPPRLGTLHPVSVTIEESNV